MNKALELADGLDAYARGDEYQRVTEEAAAMLRSQHAEIERLKADDDHICGHMIAADALRVENQKLRNALESVATMSEELSISGFARAALEETK